MKSRVKIISVCALALSALAACNQSSGSRGSARIVYVGFLPTATNDTVRLRSTPITFTKETPLRVYFRCTDEFGLKQYDAALRPTFAPPAGVQPINFVRSANLTGTNVLVNDVVINSSVSQASGIYRLTLTCTNANNQTSDVITQDFTLVCPPAAPPGACQ